MINKLKKFLATLSAGLLIVTWGLPVVALAAGTDCLSGSSSGGITNCLNAGANETDANGQTGDTAAQRVNKTIKLVINVFSLVVGVVSVIMIIIGGLKYITSGGESSNITGAKNTILYAIIGLVVVALAQVIVKFVLEKATGNI